MLHLSRTGLRCRLVGELVFIDLRNCCVLRRAVLCSIFTDFGTAKTVLNSVKMCLKNKPVVQAKFVWSETESGQQNQNGGCLETVDRFPVGTRDFFLVCKTSRPALGATQSTVQLIPGPLSPGTKQSRSEAAHKNELSDISTTIYALMAFTGATYLDVMA